MAWTNQYSNSHIRDSNYVPGDFVLSSVSKKELDRYGINMKVKGFVEMVKESGKYKVVITGRSAHWQFKHTKVYNYNDFRN